MIVIINGIENLNARWYKPRRPEYGMLVFAEKQYSIYSLFSRDGAGAAVCFLTGAYTHY
jgi:hypothetical protein